MPADCSLADSTIWNSQRRSSEPSPSPRCGCSFTPVPSGVRRQFGDKGTTPLQYGQRTVWAQTYPSGRTSSSGSSGNTPTRRRRISLTSLVPSSKNGLRISGPSNVAGHSTVARPMRTATGLRSLAYVVNPSRIASKGTAPPPAVGSSTVVSPSIESANQSASSTDGVYRKARTYPYASAPSRFPVRVATAIRALAATGSP